MAERARAVILASTATGDIIPDATVTVRNPGTTVNITDTIFANDDPDTTQLTNGVFKTDARGLAIFYLTNQKRVDVLFTKAGVTSVTIPVDVQKSSLVSGYGVVMDEATTLTQRGTLRFTGDGVAATDDAVNGRTNATIPGIAGDPLFNAAGDLIYGTANDTGGRLAIGTAGQVLKVNAGATAPEWGAGTSAFVGARVHRTTNQIITTGTETAVQFDNERYDTDAFHDNVTNNTRLTIPSGKGGYYRVTANITFASGNIGGREVRMRLNGNIDIGRVTEPTNIDTYQTALPLAVDYNLVATDFLEVIVTHSQGSNLDVIGTVMGCSFMLQYLGA